MKTTTEMETYVNGGENVKNDAVSKMSCQHEKTGVSGSGVSGRVVGQQVDFRQ